MSHAPAQPLRVLLFGYGLAGQVFHGPLLTAGGDYTIDVIVTSDPARSAAARAAHPGAQVVADADAAFALAGDCDLAVVCTPNDTHVELARRALDEGLHVVVDKPLALTVKVFPSAARLPCWGENRGVVARRRRSLHGAA
ncbi:Gfo/Idh/MocA family oxidoreductase, partial [Nonomuraea sp. NPDC049158]|uniref:Gfo/Idh/MocA family oxidoreductase n=1 Tax=Nonomuraea sp. NPDC049158 TaxID=3155649 RepID=UPI0033C55BAB